MGTWVLVLLAAAPLKLAAPALGRLNITEEEAAYHLDAFVSQLRGDGLEVTTSAQIATILGHERQRELLGCSDSSSSCMAELANALGVDGILKANLGRIGDHFELDVTVLRSTNASLMAGFSGSVDGAKHVRELLETAAAALRKQLVRRPVSTSRPWLALLPAGLGVGSTVAGALLWSSSNTRTQALDAHDLTRVVEPLSYAQSARNERGAGIALVAVGAALFVAGLVWFLLGGAG